MSFDELVGQEFDFSGVDGHTFKLGDTVFEALENEDDGYRSYMDSVEVKDPTGLIFFGRPLARVKLESINEKDVFSGYRLVDIADDHVWLRLGTDNLDDYYPAFIFEYAPKAA